MDTDGEISPNMADPRDPAGNAEEAKDEEDKKKKKRRR